MGNKPSNTASLQPAQHEPAILFHTDTGVIVRTRDATSADEVAYHFNPRNVPATSLGEIVATDGGTVDDTGAQRQILVVKGGAQNRSMRGKIVYVKIRSRP